MVWSHLFFYHLLSAVALYCLLSSDVWCHLFKVVMQHFPLFCPQFPSRGEVTQQQQQADHCSTTMGQYWGDQCTAIWWNQTPRITNSSSSEGWNYQVDKQDKNFHDLDQITEELLHIVPSVPVLCFIVGRDPRLCKISWAGRGWDEPLASAAKSTMSQLRSHMIRGLFAKARPAPEPFEDCA